MQPDSIIPDPTNPQSWNRYSYVLNSPINLSDPTGHESVCGQANSDPECGDLGNSPLSHPGPKTPLPKPGGGNSGSNSNNNGTEPITSSETNDQNPCVGTPPYIPQYICGVAITEPSYPWMTNSPHPDDYTGHGYGGGESLARGPNAIDLSMIFFENLVFNTNLIQRAFDRSAYGIIPFITSNSTGNTAVFGVGIYNHTGWDVVIGSMEINGVNQRVDNSKNFTPDNLVIVPIIPQSTVDQNQVSINYSIYSAGSYIGLGTIRYQGPIGP